MNPEAMPRIINCIRDWNKAFGTHAIALRAEKHDTGVADAQLIPILVGLCVNSEDTRETVLMKGKDDVPGKVRGWADICVAVKC